MRERMETETFSGQKKSGKRRAAAIRAKAPPGPVVPVDASRAPAIAGSAAHIDAATRPSSERCKRLAEHARAHARMRDARTEGTRARMMTSSGAGTAERRAPDRSMVTDAAIPRTSRPDVQPAMHAEQGRRGVGQDEEDHDRDRDRDSPPDKAEEEGQPLQRVVEVVERRIQNADHLQ